VTIVRRAAERRGRRGEWLAALWLRLHGWRILGRRCRTPVGEVDIVARRLGVVAFVEVKARASRAECEIALDRHRIRRVAAAAELLAPRFARDGEAVRIDAILVPAGRWPIHLPNVWHG
jgi:putative endonuclease